MSVEHLDILYAELPDLFQIRDLSPVWDDDLLIIKIEDPEWNGGESNDELAKGRIDQLSSSDLENWGADLRDTLWMAPNAVSVPAFSDVVIDVLVGAHAGAPIPYTDRSKMPPSDCLAFYLPFHYYHPTWWGVYLLFEGVLWLANEIVRRSGGSVNRIGAIRGSRLFLYYHEAFHHKTECFATRLALTHRKPFFKDGFERLYKNTIGTADCLEEGLSNAVALLDSHRRMKGSEGRSGPNGLRSEFSPWVRPGGQDPAAGEVCKMPVCREKPADLSASPTVQNPRGVADRASHVRRHFQYQRTGELRYPSEFAACSAPAVPANASTKQATEKAEGGSQPRICAPRWKPRYLPNVLQWQANQHTASP